MTIRDNNVKGSAGVSRRVLAVIAGNEAQAGEIATQFAKQGEEVEAVWYPGSKQLLAEKGTPRFEAVILFPLLSEAATDADEIALRSALSGTPLYRVG